MKYNVDRGCLSRPLDYRIKLRSSSLREGRDQLTEETFVKLDKTFANN